jgi:hypothetical protein
MKTKIAAVTLISLVFVSCNETKNTITKQDSESLKSVLPTTKEIMVPFTTVSNYFVKNDFKEAELQGVLLTSQAEFDKIFGFATTMGGNGKPTEINFTKQNVIICICATSEMENKLTVNAIKKVGAKLVVIYSLEEGKKQTFSSRNFVAMLVDKNFSGAIELVKI